MAATALSHAYPLGTRVNERGHLEVGGCDVVELAERHGTPAYIYAEDDMRAQARAYVEAFQARYALQQGAVSVAAEHFRAATAALRTDPYDAAWMVAECAGLFRASRELEMREHLAAAHRTASELGYVPLARRLGSALRASGVMSVIPSHGA